MFNESVSVIHATWFSLKLFFTFFNMSHRWRYCSVVIPGREVLWQKNVVWFSITTSYIVKDQVLGNKFLHQCFPGSSKNLANMITTFNIIFNMELNPVRSFVRRTVIAVLTECLLFSWPFIMKQMKSICSIDIPYKLEQSSSEREIEMSKSNLLFPDLDSSFLHFLMFR